MATSPKNETRKFRYSDAPLAPAAASGIAAPALPAEVPALPLKWSHITLALLVLLACFIALYPTDLFNLASKWYSDSGWSHGFVVPLISVFLVNLKWDKLRLLTPKGSMVGLLILALGVFGQICFRATATDHMSNLSIIVVLLGAVLFIFGWEHLKLLWLPIGYLICAIPIPSMLYVSLTAKLQIVAAQLGLFFVQLFGAEAELSGAVINVFHDGKPVQLEVEFACSGMKMLVAFFAVAVALAYSTSRPVWQKVFLAACALPTAIFCNALRVAGTSLLVARLGEEWGKGSTHAYFGMLMLIPAMLMQLGLAWILDRIFVDDRPPHTPPKAARGAA